MPASDPDSPFAVQVAAEPAFSVAFSVQSDCPAREKFGYGGDIVGSSEMAILNFDMARLYAKTVRDFADAARPNGGITETAPYVGIADGGFGGGSGPIGRERWKRGGRGCLSESNGASWGMPRSPASA